MRRRCLLLALALMAVGLAGCIGSDGEALEDANTTDAETAEANATDLGTLPDGSPVPTATTMTGCHEQVGTFPVSERMYASEVPDGFQAVGFDPVGETAALVVFSAACSMDGEDHAETWGMLVVEPPEELASEDADFSLLVLGAITSTERQTATYEAWGLGQGILDGEVTVETLQETPANRAGHVLATDGEFTVHVYSDVGGEPMPTDAGKARLFGADEGELTGVVDVTWTESEHGYETGEATLAFEGDAPLPRPESAGVGAHYWGEDYEISYEHVGLDDAG